MKIWGNQGEASGGTRGVVWDPPWGTTAADILPAPSTAEKAPFKATLSKQTCIVHLYKYTISELEYMGGKYVTNIYIYIIFLFSDTLKLPKDQSLQVYI